MSDTNLNAAAQIELTNKMNEFVEMYHANADLRARTESEPRAVLTERGLDALAPSPGAEVRIVADTDDTIHFMLPPDPNAEMSDEDLMNITGGTSLVPSPDSISCYQAVGATTGATSSGW